MSPRHEPCSRREFYGRLVRYTALGGLGMVTGVLAARRSRLPNQTCIEPRGICRSCGVVASCGLPQALSARRVAET